jgi:hypothetical protein
MDIKQIVETINRDIGVAGGEPFEANGDSESFHRTVVHGSISGRDVRVQVDVDDNSGPYRYSIWLYDEETGETLGRGNGDASLKEASEIYQWSGAIADLKKLG